MKDMTLVYEYRGSGILCIVKDDNPKHKVGGENHTCAIAYRYRKDLDLLIYPSH